MAVKEGPYGACGTVMRDACWVLGVGCWVILPVLYVSTPYGACGTVMRDACCVKCYMVLWRVYLSEALEDGSMFIPSLRCA